MSVLDNIAKQVYLNNKQWFDNIIKYINENPPDLENKQVFLFLDNGLTQIDINYFKQTYEMISIVFATLGINVERTHVIHEKLIYDGLCADCSILCKNGKFEQLSIKDIF